MHQKFWNNGRITRNVPHLMFDSCFESHWSTFILIPSMVKEFMTKSCSKQSGILQEYSSNSRLKTLVLPAASESSDLISFNSHFNPYTTATILEMLFLTMTLKCQHDHAISKIHNVYSLNILLASGI